MTNAIKPSSMAWAWYDLRAYRNACDDYTALLARDAREWHGCAVGYDMTLTIAARERQQLYEKALQWAYGLRFRVEEHAAADGAPLGKDSMFNINEGVRANGC